MWQTAAKALGKIKKDKSLTLIFFYFFAGINKPSKLPTTAGKNQATPASYKGKAWTKLLKKPKEIFKLSKLKITETIKVKSKPSQ